MRTAVIDNFSLALTHGLLLLVAWRLLFRADLDTEGPPPPDEVPPSSRFDMKPAKRNRPGA
jgi:hypothetical protein